MRNKAIGTLVLIFPILFLVSKSHINTLFWNNTVLFWIFDSLVFVVFPAIAVYLSFKFYRIAPESYGLMDYKRNNSGYSLSFLVEDLVLSVSLFLIISFGTIYFLSIFIPSETVSNVYTERTSQLSGVLYFFTLTYLSITSAITEELFFRGVLFKVVSDFFVRTGVLTKPIYIMVSSGLFTAAHIGYDAVDLIGIFIFGVVACLLFLRSRHLEHLIMAHFVTNMILL